MSRHHWNIVISIRAKPVASKVIEFVCIQIVKPAVNKRAAVAPVKGHGLGSTI